MLDIYFLSGKISSFEKKFIDYEKMKRIIECKTFEEFIVLLEGTFYKLPSGISNSEEILKYFENEKDRLIEEIEKTFENDLRYFLLLKYDYFNFANLIEGKDKFSTYGTLNYYLLKDAFEKNDLLKIPEILKDAFRISKVTKSTEEKLLLLKIDYYRKMYKISEKFSDYLKNYVKIEIDFANLETYLNKKLVNKKIEISDFIENGNIRKEFFLDEENLWKKVATEYKKVKTPLNEENIEFEKYKVIMDYIRNARVMSDTIDKIVSFYIAREIEIKNLQRISVAKFYKQEEEFLKEIIFPPYQYKNF